MKDYGKAVREKLLASGCWLVRHGRGSHDVWRSPQAAKPFTVPVKVKSRHMANEILKDAGLPKVF